MRTTAAAAGMLVLLASCVAFGQTEARPDERKARGVFVAHDAAAETVTLRERGKLQAYALLGGGDAGETEVSIESESARVSDLEEGAAVIVTWRPDAEDRARRIATRIEAPKIPKSFREELR